MTEVSENNGKNETSEKNENSNINNEERQEQNEKGGHEEVIQTNLQEEDYIGLDVVDAWDEEEKDRPRRRSWDRTAGKEKFSRERDRDRERERERERDRNRNRGRRRSRSGDRKRSRSGEKKNRRDPSKSSKDIEQDKLRTKKDNDTKMLAEKEKAIKTLLDSNDVVPPGTEEEAIQIIVDKNQQQPEDANKARRNSRERRRSPVRNRLGYRRFSPARRSPIRRSPIRSSNDRRRSRSVDRRRSPITFSPDRRRRRSPIRLSPDDRRRRSYDRENSEERREASRRRLRDRQGGVYGSRRSRSRDRRSVDRHRSRSLERRRRSSRSPFERRRRSLSRSPLLRSPSRGRRRSPFINELARQFQNDALRPENGMPPMGQSMPPMGVMGPGAPGYMPSAGGPPPGMPMDPRMMGGPPGGPPGMPQGMMPSGPPGSMDMGGMPMMHPGGPPAGGPPFMNYEAGPPPGGYDPINRGLPPPEYSGPYPYGQVNPMGVPHPMRSLSPQPVPAPVQGTMMFPGPVGAPMQPLQPATVPGSKYSPNTSGHDERMKTPEPPIISDFKQNEKTSLSSLLEASVSTKDSASTAPTFKGFRPEIIRHCERALRSLPTEDPRLKMKGRFFFDPAKKLDNKEAREVTSNSVLLRKGRTEIHWDEEMDQLAQQQQPVQPRKRVVTHQKICQTDEATRESISVQTELTTSEFGMQVDPEDLMPAKEDRPRQEPLVEEPSRRLLVDRLDWSMRETYDHASKLRDNEDLRWSLSSNSRERPMNSWSRGYSPNRQGPMSDIRPSGMDGMNRDRSGSGIGGVIGGGMDRGIDHGIDHGIDRGIDRGMDRGIDRGMDRGIDRGLDRGLDRGMDIREHMMSERDRMMDNREMDMRDRDVEMREMDMMRDRMMNSRGGMMDMGSRGMDDFPSRMREPLDDYSRGRDSLDEYDLRKNFSGNFNRNMDLLDRGRNDMARGGGVSPVGMNDDPEELEIIEERGKFDNLRQPTWTNSNIYNNARGGAAIRGTVANRSFRGRLGGFRNKF